MRIPWLVLLLVAAGGLAGAAGAVPSPAAGGAAVVEIHADPSAPVAGTTTRLTALVKNATSGVPIAHVEYSIVVEMGHGTGSEELNVSGTSEEGVVTLDVEFCEPGMHMVTAMFESTPETPANDSFGKAEAMEHYTVLAQDANVRIDLATAPAVPEAGKETALKLTYTMFGNAIKHLYALVSIEGGMGHGVLAIGAAPAMAGGYVWRGEVQGGELALRFTFEEPGDYTLRAEALAPRDWGSSWGATAEFAIEVPPPKVKATLTVTATDPRLGTVNDVFLEAKDEAGATIDHIIYSAQVVDAQGNTVLATGDIHAHGGRYALKVVFPAAGTYTVRATVSMSDHSMVSFDLTAGNATLEVPPLPAPDGAQPRSWAESVPLALGALIAGAALGLVAGSLAWRKKRTGGKERPGTGK